MKRDSDKFLQSFRRAVGHLRTLFTLTIIDCGVIMSIIYTPEYLEQKLKSELEATHVVCL